MELIKKELQYTIHNCKNMGLYKSIMLKRTNVWELHENLGNDSVFGTKKIGIVAHTVD